MLVKCMSLTAEVCWPDTSVCLSSLWLIFLLSVHLLAFLTSLLVLKLDLALLVGREWAILAHEGTSGLFSKFAANEEDLEGDEGEDEAAGSDKEARKNLPPGQSHTLAGLQMTCLVLTGTAFAEHL